MWHVESSSPTKDQTHAPLQWKCGVLTTGYPGKSLFLFFVNSTGPLFLQRSTCPILAMNIGNKE